MNVDLRLEEVRTIVPTSSSESLSGFLSLATIARTLSSIAKAHATRLGIFSVLYSDRDMGWVVMTSYQRILRPVPTDVPLKLETWVSSIEGGKLHREYRISNVASATPLLEAIHTFVLFDRSTRRPVILPKFLREKLNGQTPTYRFGVQLDRRSLPDFSLPPSRPSEVHESQHLVEDAQVDANRHLNNTVYLGWLSEHLERLEVLAPYEVGIEYLIEASLGNRIKLRTRAEASASRKMLHRFDDEATGKAFAVALTISTR